MRKLPRWLKVTLVIGSCLLLGALALYNRMIAMAAHTESAYQAMVPIDLNVIADGTYSGSAGEFIVSVDLDVVVQAHRITQVQVKRQVNGGGHYQASELPQRMVEQQSCRVDAVSGATLTSKTIMVAVNRALQNAGR